MVDKPQSQENVRPEDIIYNLGDIVVYRTYGADQLHKVDELYPNDPNSVGITGLKKREGWLKAIAEKKSIRPATPKEKRARRRLDDPN